MGSLVIAVAAGGLLVLVVLTSAAVGARRTARRARARMRAVDERSARSQEALEQLREQVTLLSSELAELRREAARQTPEYVITSLAQDTPAARASAELVAPLADSRRIAGLEDHLVQVLAAQQDVSTGRARMVGLVVKTVALGHGVRRALTPDVLDRAAAEAHVARRRSRRTRKREEREARRLLRAVKEQRREQRAA